MAQIPKGRLVKGPYKPICRDCAIYFSITVSEEGFCIFWRHQSVTRTLVIEFPGCSTRVCEDYEYSQSL